jgi:hypothetical protein
MAATLDSTGLDFAGGALPEDAPVLPSAAASGPVAGFCSAAAWGGLAARSAAAGLPGDLAEPFPGPEAGSEGVGAGCEAADGAAEMLADRLGQPDSLRV